MPADAPRRLSCTAVVGLQWGDEGKGKLVDWLTPTHAAVVRYNGGANAGHSVVVDGARHALHLVPSGILHSGVLAVIGNGVVVDPETLLGELDVLTKAGVDVSGLRLSSRAHVVLMRHKAHDAASETRLASPEDQETRAIGTTLRGIGPAYAEKAHRALAVRVTDLLHERELRRKLRLAATLDPTTPEEDAGALLEYGERLRPHVCDTFYLLHDLLEQRRSILFEGANGALLDVDHGAYPFVTSSTCSVLGVGPGTGVSERSLTRVVGVAKAYCTRVGAGPFPTELDNDTGARLRERGNEFGTTTGRPRRCGWLDLVALRYTVKLNRCTEIALTLLDVLAGFDELRVCVGYQKGEERTERFLPDAVQLGAVSPEYETLEGFDEEITSARTYDGLPKAARAYIDRIEAFVGVRVGIVSVGPDREQTIIRS